MSRNYASLLSKPVFKHSVRNYTPRRALMYVPGDDMKKILKAFVLDIDCVTLDCEDGVALNKKAQARLNIRDMLAKGKPIKQRSYDFAVRVNAISSDIIKDDLSVICTGPHLPDTILLPKVDSSDNLNMFSGYLDEYIKTNSKVGLILGIESPLSLINLVNICETAKELSKTSKFTPEALLFGSDDFYASVGAKKSDSLSEVLYARQKMVTIAKAFGLQAIDAVYIKFKDDEGLKKQSEEGARLGYTGKQVIHPSQIEIVHNAFIPTKKEIEWAKAILKKFHSAQQQGEGAFSYQGSMIDMPTVKQAQNIMDLINAVMIKQ